MNMAAVSLLVTHICKRTVLGNKWLWVQRCEQNSISCLILLSMSAILVVYRPSSDANVRNLLFTSDAAVHSNAYHSSYKAAFTTEKEARFYTRLREVRRNSRVCLISLQQTGPAATTMW